MEPKVVYMLFDKNNKGPIGVYSRAYHNEYEFESESDARTSNVHGIYQDKEEFKVKKFMVSYKEIFSE